MESHPFLLGMRKLKPRDGEKSDVTAILALPKVSLRGHCSLGPLQGAAGGLQTAGSQCPVPRVPEGAQLEKSRAGFCAWGHSVPSCQCLHLAYEFSSSSCIWKLPEPFILVLLVIYGHSLFYLHAAKRKVV